MNNKIKFLKSLFLPLFLILFFTINITSDHISDIFSRIGQQASVIKSTRVENIYNISPSKKFPGVFNFEYQYAKLPTNKKEANFDLSILPFDEEKARAVLKQEYGLEYVDFGPIRDAWGYPVRENAFMKKEETKKQSFLDSLKINKALAYDEDTQNPGVYNCRANTSITGYFKAYFEDVALNTSVGFDDPAYGEGRREEACQVLQDISEMIMLDQTNVTPDILFEMNNPSMPPGALAGASSYFDYNSTNPNNGSLHRHIISQQDPTPEAGNFDAFILTNFSVNWSVDSSLNQNTYDFYTVMWHEMMHALGFRRLLPAVISQTGVEHTHGTFDSHTYKDESLQNRFITAVTNLLNVPVGAPSPWFVTNQVVYRGVKNILGATPDGIRPIYSPTSWQQGSSLSHFDMNRAGGEEYVMHPSIGTNTDREIHEHELEVLCHLGYMVEGLAGCEVPTPVAMDDYVFLNETNSVCIKPLINDVPVGPGSLGSLHINSVTPISIEQGDTIDYYSNGNCNGALLPSMYGARSILFTPSSLNVDRVLKYSNKRSNSIRLSNEAVILTLPPLPSCEDVTDPNEYVCNGGFDAVSPPGNEVYSLIHCSSWGTSSNIGAYGYVLNTCNFSGTPDVIMEDSYIPAGFAASSSPAPTGTTFPYLRSGVFDNIGTGHSFERTIMMLGQPLTPGEEYILSFDHAYKGLLPGFEIDFYVIMSTPVSLSMSTPIPNPNQNIFNQVQSGNPLEWHSYSQNFIANNTYISVVFYADGVKNEPQSWNYFDNISIRPVNAPPPPPPPVYLGSLTGHLYQDLNQNGSYQSSTEPRLSGIQVGLFQDGSNMP
ncbi:MAG: hypothetical protein QG566_737, partial [Patescibacteria group bacterium]|nr:hypothetical protein [Patescibacteria group bacterium]